MKLQDINKALNKYSTKQAGLNKSSSTGDPDKSELPDTTGNQTTPMKDTGSKLTGGAGNNYPKDQAKPDNLVSNLL